MRGQCDSEIGRKSYVEVDARASQAGTSTIHEFPTEWRVRRSGCSQYSLQRLRFLKFCWCIAINRLLRRLPVRDPQWIPFWNLSQLIFLNLGASSFAPDCLKVFDGFAVGLGQHARNLKRIFSTARKSVVEYVCDALCTTLKVQDFCEYTHLKCVMWISQRERHLSGEID